MSRATENAATIKPTIASSSDKLLSVSWRENHATRNPVKHRGRDA
jgi:hypothetical protein